MKQKKTYIAASVTTQEALAWCLTNQIPLFCIEEPLYTALQQRLPAIKERFQEYVLQEYPQMRFILLKKVHGANVFDSEKYDIFYLPLQNQSAER